MDKLIFNFLAGKVTDYPWARFLKDKKETYEFYLWSNVHDPRLVTLTILDFPQDWFTQGIGMIGAVKLELPLDQLKRYANPDGPLALLLSRK